MRLFGMTLLLFLLCAAFVPTTSYNWVAASTLQFDRNQYPPQPEGIASNYSLNAAIPVKCFWHEPFNGKGQIIDYSRAVWRINPDAPFTYFILLCTYVWKAVEISRRPKRPIAYDQEDDPSPSWIRRQTLARLARRARQTARKIGMSQDLGAKGYRQNATLLQRYWGSLLLKLRLITYANLLIVFDFLGSFLASLLVLTILSVWGLLSIVNIRNKSSPEVHNEERTWGFGQVVPILLLAAPFLAVVTHFLRMSSIFRPSTALIERLIS